MRSPDFTAFTVSLALALLGCDRGTSTIEHENAAKTEAKTATRTEAEPMPDYDKREVRIPMRDGVELFTIIYSPKDRRTTYPILLTRTAYGIGPYGPDDMRETIGPSPAFAAAGYIVVYQDTRGKFESGGEFVHHRPLTHGAGVDESTDAYDTIEWLLANVDNHNGRVGQWGISWAGWEVSMAMIDAHPALRASSPQVPPQDQFLGDDHHSGGAFQLMYAFAWMANHAMAKQSTKFDYGTPDGYEFFLRLGAAANAGALFDERVPTWDDYMVHGTYDEYWQARNVPKDLRGVRHPVLLVASWFDAQDFWGPLRMYEALVEHNPEAEVHFVIGPWIHGGHARTPGDRIGAIEFGSNTAEHYRDEVELPFFEHVLKDAGELDLPPVLAFETGVNQWRELERWPPPGTEPLELHLAAAGVLLAGAGAGENAGFDAYVSDPAKPVPYSAEIRTIEGHEFMVEDQRFAATRPDVLVYQTEPLTEDLTIAGPIVAHLQVETTGTDADFVVKLIDVFPGDAPDPEPNPRAIRMGGYQMLLAADILRAKFRRSFTTPEPMVPGTITKLEIPLGDKYHTFRAGHRIMVQVQSSWFPLFDRNPQTFVDIYHAEPSDFQKAEHRVHRTREAPSFVRVEVLRR